MDSLPREEDVFVRPAPDEIRSAWDKTFSDPLISLSRLRSRSLDKAGLGPAAPDGGVLLRSVYWRFYHSLLPPPTCLDLFPPALEASREAYKSLRRRYLVAPDGRWAADCSGFDESPSSSAHTSPNPNSINTGQSSSTSQGEGWDPLSLSTSSPWKTWFAQVDLRATLRKDVDRTFPDMAYFQLERVKRCMTTALFIFAVLNPDVGYRQGMHELFACCLLAVDRDSLDQAVKVAGGVKEEAMYRMLDRTYVEHDAFQLFEEIMKSAKAFYEWRAEEGPVRSKSPSAPQAPVITRCINLQTSLLRRTDPQLWDTLENEGVEAQIWAIRWIRLIFTRELPFGVAMRLWDGVFAEDPGLQLLDYICIAMLLLIRNELVQRDYSTILTNLLHYPSPSFSYPFEPFLILAQAVFLRNAISPAAGVEIVIQNQDLLGVKATASDREADEAISTHSRPGLRGGNGSMSGTMRARGAQRAGVGGLAQGLFERAQAAGLDKAFMTTVNDLRKNLPDSTTAYSYLPNLPFSPSQSPGPRSASSSFSTLPSSNPAIPTRSFFQASSTRISPLPPWPQIQSRPSIDSQTSDVSVKTVKDAEREMAELRLAMLGMGKAMNEWLEVIQDPSVHIGETERKSAWEGLGRVRDTLIEAAGRDVDEIVKEWGWHDGLEAPGSRSTTPASPGLSPTPAAPVPAPLSLVKDESPKSSAPPTVGPSSMDFEDTPTQISTAVLPNKPRYPGAPRESLTPPRVRVSASSRPLRVSPSTKVPVTGLPRVPYSAPLASNYITAFEGSEGQGPATAGLGFSFAEQHLKETGAGKSRSSDPLAGLGVTEREDKRTSAGGKSRGVDPLLGVGVE